MAEIEVYLMCDTIRSLKSTYAGSLIIDLHRKFIFGFCCHVMKRIYFLGLDLGIIVFS